MEESSETDKEDKVKDDIISAAQALFQQFGWKKTNMEDIAKKAGKGKSTLYYYFKSKEDIFYAVLNKEMKCLTDDVKKAVEIESSFEGKIRVFFQTKMKEFFNAQNLYTAIRDYLADNFIQIQKKFAEKHEREDVIYLANILQKGMEQELITERDQRKLEETAYGMILSVKGVIIEMTFIDEEFQIFENKLNILLDLLLYGLLKS